MMTREMMMNILMETRMTKADAERHIKKGCTIWENPENYIQCLKDNRIWQGQTVDSIRQGLEEDLETVTYEGHEYLIEYVL